MLITCSLSLFLFAGSALASGESFEALVARWEATDGAEARVGLLDAIAQAGRDEGLADGAVVGALSDGLADESFDVRGRAAELIAGFDPRFALRALRSAVEDLNERHEELLERLKEATGDVPKRKEPRRLGEDMTEEFHAIGRLARAQNEFDDGQQTLHLLRSRYAGALGRIDDKLSVRLLRDLSKPLPPSSQQDVIVEAWLSIGSRSALQEIVELFKLHEKDIEGRERVLAEAKAQPDPKLRTLSSAMRDLQVEKFVAQLEERREWGSALTARMKAYAETKGLSKPPPASATPSEAWVKWLRWVRGELH